MSDLVSGTATFQPTPVSGSTWQPIVGNELEEMLERQFQGADGSDPQSPISVVRQSTIEILSKCIDPKGEPARNTGLIVGYVQSGKTMSFTAVTAAAQDNGFKIVIVLGGTVNILLEQTKERIEEDLETGEHPGRPWASIQNPDSKQRENLIRILSTWDDPKGDRETALITVLKNANSSGGGRLHKLAEVLESIPSDRLGAALIIDDEADQVSLNTQVRAGRKSPNFAAIERIRNALPHHTYLQYTATPQAPIFIPMVNLLSPDFAHVLKPGGGYVGGREFFPEQSSPLVKKINTQELDEAEKDNTPPDSLLKALRLFLVGVALGHVDRANHVKKKFDPENRTMMIHPSRLVRDASSIHFQVRQMLNQWYKILSGPEDEPDRADCLGEFEKAYIDLRKTAGEQLVEFDQLLEWLPTSIKLTRLELVNSLGDIKDWKSAFKTTYSWILVGGQQLDRGFTVSGLTVTWMPRGPGVFNADTIQQRARFFGYKRKYLDLCRVFLDPEVLSAFKVYVPSEESMRAFLERHSDPGKLKEPGLVRKFQMDPALKPCRISVIVDNPFYSKNGTKWISQSRPHADLHAMKRIRVMIDDFLTPLGNGRIAKDTCNWLPKPEKATEAHIHNVWDGIDPEAYANLLAAIEPPDPDDYKDWQSQLALLSLEMESNPEMTGAIVLMRPTEKSRRSLAKKRKIKDPDDSKKKIKEPCAAIKNLAQGANPSTGKNQGSVYKGDRAVRPAKVTLQVYTVDLDHDPTDGGEIFKDVTALRLFVQREKSEQYIVQHQETAP